MIFVTVGSQKFQFNRLLKKVDQMAADGSIKEGVCVQTGASDFVPCNCRHQAFYDRDKFAQMVEKCSVFITHGGTGTIVDAVKRGKKAIVVPRLARYGEHVDDHQLQLLERFHELNLVYACTDVEKLPELLKGIRTHRFDTWQSNTEAFIASIDEDIWTIFGGGR